LMLPLPPPPNRRSQRAAAAAQGPPARGGGGEGSWTRETLAVASMLWAFVFY
jgi:hypothetical protein